MASIKDLGQTFRQKRKEMHLSLKEIENATSIRMMYLQAIEEGDIEKHLSAVYALGFIKQYANFLGFDGEKIIKENHKVFNMNNKREFEYGLGAIDMRNENNSTDGIFGSNAVWVGISLIVLLVAWGFAKMLGVL